MNYRVIVPCFSSNSQDRLFPEPPPFAMDRIDLHTHSSCSDGTLSPAGIVDWAVESGLRVVALTDHDTMAGVEEAQLQGRRRGIEVVPGVELSVWHEETPLHLLGYWARPDDPVLEARLQWIQNARDERNNRILAKLDRLGIAIEMEELRQLGAADQLGRPHFARLLVAKGVVRNVEQAFSMYLRRGAVAYVERRRFAAQEAIAAISRAGGLPVLAHPGRVNTLHRGLSHGTVDHSHPQGIARCNPEDLPDMVPTPAAEGDPAAPVQFLRFNENTVH